MNRLHRWTQISNVSALQLYNLQRFGVTLLIGILLAQLGLTTAEIAMYEALLFLGNLVSFFWIGGGQNALLSFYPKVESTQQKYLLGQVFYLFLGLSILAAGFLWLAQSFILEQLTQFSNLPYLHWICWYLVFNIPSYLNQIILLLKEKYRSMVGYSTLIHGAQLILVIIPVFFQWRLEWIFINLLAWSVVKFIYTLFLLYRFGSFRFRIRLWGPYLAILSPLMLHLLIGNSVEYIDGLIVTSHFTDEGTFAIFRYGARELPLTVLLIGAVVTAMIPVASASLSEGLEQIKEKTLRLAHWLFPLSVLLMISSPWLFPFVYTEDFQASSIVFNWYLLILGTRILLPQVILIAQGHNYFLVVSALIETVVNVVLSLWWVQWFGLGGIAAASVFANLINKGNMMIYCWWKLGIRPRQYIPWRWYFFYLALLIGSFIFAHLWWNLES